MSWDNIDKASVNPEAAKKQTAEKRAKAAALAKAYNRCFNSEEGKQVIADLHKRFIYDNDTSVGSPNVNYESAYHNGESGVVKFIINQINQAETL